MGDGHKERNAERERAASRPGGTDLLTLPLPLANLEFSGYNCQCTADSTA
jgi:hypothetical protein